jgi:hypothetical protein
MAFLSNSTTTTYSFHKNYRAVYVAGGGGGAGTSRGCMVEGEASDSLDQALVHQADMMNVHQPRMALEHIQNQLIEWVIQEYKYDARTWGIINNKLIQLLLSIASIWTTPVIFDVPLIQLLLIIRYYRLINNEIDHC